MFWALSIAITLIVLTLLYLAQRPGPSAMAAAGDVPATRAHFKTRLEELHQEQANGRLSAVEAEAAKAELARELVRLESETHASGQNHAMTNPAIWVLMLLVPIIAFASYFLLGQPDLPATPLVSRANPSDVQMDVNEAVARVEAQMKNTPDDVRGWAVLAPVYMQQGRYDEAENAWRRVIALSGASADSQTRLAEALMAQQNPTDAAEIKQLLQSAADSDPNHIPSRFYLAQTALAEGDQQTAIEILQAIIDRAKGDEAYLPLIRDQLQAAQEGTTSPQIDPDQGAMIRSMVEGLSERLFADGGTIAEWTRLVRSRLVLGERDLAQRALNAARKAYPDAVQRDEIERLAQEAGLE